MGWPGCMHCDNWPSVGYTGLCKICITNPKLVEEIAEQMFNNVHQSGLKDLESSCLLAFLDRETNGTLVKKVLSKLESDTSLKVTEAIKQVRKEYWSNENN